VLGPIHLPWIHLFDFPTRCSMFLPHRCWYLSRSWRFCYFWCSMARHQRRSKCKLYRMLHSEYLNCYSIILSLIGWLRHTHWSCCQPWSSQRTRIGLHWFNLHLVGCLNTLALPYQRHLRLDPYGSPLCWCMVFRYTYTEKKRNTKDSIYLSRYFTSVIGRRT
jgi:hypothetical protein